AARPHRRCESPRSRQVRVDEDFDGFLDAVRPRRQAERTATSCCGLRQDVTSAPSRYERPLELALPFVRGLEEHVGRERLTEADRGGPGGAQPELRRDAAR